MSVKEKRIERILELYNELAIDNSDRKKLQEVITGCSSLEAMTEKELRLLTELLEELTLEPKDFQATTLKYLLKLAKRT